MEYPISEHRLSFVAGTVACFAILLGIAGCDGADKPTAPAVAPPKLTLKVLSGHNQTVEVGKWVPETLAVQVTNPSGAGVPGTLVNWNVASGGGVFDNQKTTTNTFAGHDGSTAVNFRPSGLGTNTVTAVIGAASEPATFKMNVVLTLTGVVVISNEWWPWGDFMAAHGSADVDVPVGTTIEWVNVVSASYGVDSVRIASTSAPVGGAPFSAILRGSKSFQFVLGVAGSWTWRATYFQSGIPGYEIYEGVTGRITAVLP
jgi:hypothetical protein